MKLPAPRPTRFFTGLRWRAVIVFVLGLALAATARCDQQVPLGVDPGLDAHADAGAAD